ncbi:nif-specific transcriptional activator NifA [Echinimonas agarilytica]|uniref:Nif-specific regulatory protein n=1 Tax=Echinimonas agarilytica TaxID=1215918 RepID=A0AA41W774_9GAMM|nr:nif-specific transcriptional activator NifA [Echinimonas agarilytica]MCM2680457.1 nif-specific transcriptional activator NifA [Echinimonas agarilytica]
MTFSETDSLADIQLAALYQVCAILGNSLNYQQTISRVLKILHEEALLEHGMLTLVDKQDSMLEIDFVYSPNEAPQHAAIKYKTGEGIVGAVLAQGEPVVIPLIADELRFADKLSLYDLSKPFIAVPLRSADANVIGVLAAQPAIANPTMLSAFNRFLEMCGSLIARNVVLARGIEEQTDDLQQQRDRLQRKVRSNYNMDNMVGHTQPMRKVFDQIRLVSKWDSTVLIRGESGTGKELVANAIHYNSPRAKGPFVKLNCAALPDNLLESELFGHEKGAFTGAAKQRKGRFEAAHGGTLFLDEIGEISAAFQAKLLRVLQEGEFERLGGTQSLSVDVRIVAATNRHLEDDVRDGKFREDLYYRLNVMPIQLPTLRERIEDLPELATFLVDKLSKHQKRPLKLTDGAIRRLMSYHWPGNVRQLENLLERASVMSESGNIDQDLIVIEDFSAQRSSSASGLNTRSLPTTLDMDGEMDERERVIAALEQAGWVQAKAARLLNMTPRQIAYRIQTMNINVRQM